MHLAPFTLALAILGDGQMKMFFSRQLNDYVVDEMCVCGHLKSLHGSLLHKFSNSMIREHSDGNCCSGRCNCPQYTFERFVAAEEAAQLLVNRRAMLI